MKTVIMKLKLGVLLVGLVMLSSCGDTLTVGSKLGISVIYRAIPAVSTGVTKYSEQKIAEYLKRSSLSRKGGSISEKKVEKTGGNHKTKPISISVSREARLV